MAEPKIVSVITAIKFVPIQNGFQPCFIFAVFSWKKRENILRWILELTQKENSIT
jgi:hypothetical protein